MPITAMWVVRPQLTERPPTSIDSSRSGIRNNHPRVMATNPRSLSETVLRFYRQAHERLLKAADVRPDQFAWSAGPSLHSIAWHLWHAARWDDFFAAHFQGDFGREPASEVWQRESLTSRWSLTSGSLGRRESGTEMSDEMAESLRFPDQSEVTGYARRAFAFAEEAIASIPDGLLLAVAKDDADGDSNVDNAFIYLEHLNRHLGMIEAIRGLQGMAGSVTR